MKKYLSFTLIEVVLMILSTFVMFSSYADTPFPSTSTLWVSVEGEGEGKVITQEKQIDCTKAGGEKCRATYKTGTLITLIPIAAPGSSFSSWGGNEDCVDNQVHMLGSLPCRAFFRKVVELKINKAGTGEGTVTGKEISCGTHCTQSYPIDTHITLTPQAAPGSYFSHWAGDQDCLDGQVRIAENTSCVAYFQSNLILTMKVIGHGSVKGGNIDCHQDCSKGYPSHTQVTLIAMPMSGYHFQNWSGACTGTSPLFTVTMDQSKTCLANFDSEPYSLSEGESEPKSISDSPTEIYTNISLNKIENILTTSSLKKTLEQTEVESLNQLGGELLTTLQTSVQDYNGAGQVALDKGQIEPLTEFESRAKLLQDHTMAIAMLAQNVLNQLQKGEMFLSQSLLQNMSNEELAKVLGETGLKAHVEAGLLPADRAQVVNQLGLPVWKPSIFESGGSCSLNSSSTSYLDSVFNLFFPQAEASAILGCLAICKQSFNQACVTCIVSSGARVTSEMRNLIREWKDCSGFFAWACRIWVAAKIAYLVG